MRSQYECAIVITEEGKAKNQLNFFTEEKYQCLGIVAVRFIVITEEDKAESVNCFFCCEIEDDLL